MSVDIEDSFGPAILKASYALPVNLDKANELAARFIHAQWIKGIASQSLRNNPVKNWGDYKSKYYLGYKVSHNLSNLFNVASAYFLHSISFVKVGSAYHVGTNANSNGYYYPVRLESDAKYKRPSLSPVLLNSKDVVLDYYKDALERTF